MALGAEQDWREEQGVPNTEVCLTPRPSAAQLQEGAIKLEPQGTGTAGRLPTFCWRLSPEGCAAWYPCCKGHVPPRCTKAGTHAHPCVHTNVCAHTLRRCSSHGRTVFAVSSSPSTDSEAEPKGPQSPHTQSCLPCTLGTTALFWGRKPHPIAHMSPTPLAGGDGSPEPGTGLLRDRAGHFERGWVYSHPLS